MRKQILLFSFCVASFLLGLSLLKHSTSNSSPNPGIAPIAAAAPAVQRQSAIAPLPSPPTIGAVTNPAQSTPAEFTAWLEEWKRAPDPANLPQGRALALERRDQMLHWFKNNPAQAYAESLSWSEWAALPADLQDLVEKPFSAIVDFAVLPNCPPADESLPKVHPHQVFMDGEWHEAYVFGRKTELTTKEGLPVRGILLDGKVVLAEEPFERLSAEDAAVVATLFPAKAPATISAITGLSVGKDKRTLLLGGGLYQVGSAQEESSLDSLFAAAEKSFHPKSVVMALSAAGAGAGTIAFDLEAANDAVLRASSVWTETPKSTLAVRISYSDAPAFSYSLTEMTNLMRNASNAIKVMSYGKTWLVPRVASVTLPKTRQAYQNGGPDLIVTDTRSALSAIQINRDIYDIVVHAHPGMNFSYAGLGVIGGANNWLNGNVSLEVTVHELGHNYGLGHAHFWAGVTGTGNLGRTQPDGSLMEREEYGDPFDIMGGSSLPAGQFNAYGKFALNWIEQEEIINVVTNGIYRINRYDHQDARTHAGAKLALKVSSPSGETYFVSHRRLFGSNPSLVRGANIVRVDGPGDQSLIDTTPLSRPSTAFSTDRTDSGLGIGKSFSDPLGTIHITTIASGGIFPTEHLDMQVAFLEDGAFSFYTGPDQSTNGLVGTYLNRNMRTRSIQDDWRSAPGILVGGQRIDRALSFTSDGWGARAPLRLTGGTDANWENFSVQWDGVIVVRQPVRIATTSDDSSRFWIDLDGNGSFGTTAPELVNNNWGLGQGPTRGDLSPLLPPGTYPIRIQYEEGNGGNYFTIGGADAPFEVFTDENATNPGLVGSYVARSLRSGATAQVDWRLTQPIAGTREDAYPGFTVSSWGSLSEVGLSSPANGTDADWDNFSVQWDGYLKVSVPLRMATISDDHSRMWIDLNNDGAFGSVIPEYINNAWGGGGQGTTLGQRSSVIAPGLYPIRIQYEEGGGGNVLLLAGVPEPAPVAPTLLNNTTFAGTDNRAIPREIAGDFTIQFWLRTSQIAGGEDEWPQGTGLVDATSPSPAPSFGLALGNGKVLFGIDDGNAPATTLRSGFVADDLWHHVSARRVQSTGAITLFVDGIPVGRGFGPTDSLDTLANLTVGSFTDGTGFFVGSIDQLKTWDVPRSDEQIAADFHSVRNTRGFTDAPPTVNVSRTENSIQIFWDPISGYRTLEGATTVNGNYTPLATDQNSTNITFGPNPVKFFRVRR